MKNNISLVLVFILSSCAFHQGNFSSQNALSETKGKIKGYGIGISSANYFLGIGGLKRNVLFFEAKRNMLLSYPLERGEYFANYTTDYAFKNYILFQKARITLTADIIQSSDTSYMYSKEYIKGLTPGSNTKPFFLHGDSVEVLNSNKTIMGKVIGINKKTVTVSLPSFNEPFKVVNFKQASCFKKSFPELEAKYQFKSGDSITYTVEVDKEKIKRTGLISSFNPVGILVQTDKKYTVIQYNQMSK